MAEFPSSRNYRTIGMLLDFEISNWACFKAPASFTMQATGEKRNKSTLADIGSRSRPIRIVPVAAIYGNNAAGKSQWVLALDFLRRLVLGEYKNPAATVQPFRFDETTATAPTTMKLQLLAGGKTYELEIAVAGNGIRSERLAAFNSRLTVAKLLYRRGGNRLEESHIADVSYGALYRSRDIDSASLFLSIAVRGGAEDNDLRAVFAWFRDTLNIILPSSAYVPVGNFTGESEIACRTNQYLARFDTGILRIDSEPIQLPPLPSEEQEELRRLMRPGEKGLFRRGDLLFELENGRISASRLVGVHRTRGGISSLRLQNESDGTYRMIDLIPILCKATQTMGGAVYVIDEIDRSLHSMVTAAIVEDFLAACSPASRIQLVFTTHDLSLMRGTLLRHDEMCRVEKIPSANPPFRILPPTRASGRKRTSNPSIAKAALEESPASNFATAMPTKTIWQTSKDNYSSEE